MNIVKTGMAGTMESSDINIIIGPGEGDKIEIDLQSGVEKQFGKQIRNVIENTLRSNGVTSAMVKATDKGAIDYVIIARTQAALFRACDSNDYKWGE